MPLSEWTLSELLLLILAAGLPLIIVAAASRSRNRKSGNLCDIHAPSHSPALESSGLASPVAMTSRRGAGEDMVRPFADFYAFTPDILIRTSNGEYVVAAAALDTQCQKGNWISKRLVDEIGLTNLIRHDLNPAQMITAAGEEMESCGVIKIHWKLARNENRVYRESFFVLPDVRHLDVIMGQDIINKEDLLSMSTHRLFAPLAHKKLSDSDKAAIAASEARQQQEKRDLEARRLAAQQQHSSDQSTSQHNTEAQQQQQQQSH